MGLFALLRRLLFGSPPESAGSDVADRVAAAGSTLPKRVRLAPLRYRGSLIPTSGKQELTAGKTPPYTFSHRDPVSGRYFDLSQDADTRWLEYHGLPELRTPQDLADWLGLPLNKVAWLTCRFCENYRPQSEKEAHYHFRWVRKRSGGHRLIEAPKKTIGEVQQKILRGILDHVTIHPAAHGFVRGRSILTNAEPHVDRRVILKFDLDNFYPSVRYSRVVAIFRSLGYSREVALWLARLTTSAIPGNLKIPLGQSAVIWKYLPRHLPQGACTSPALANLSAYGLDIRLNGLAQKYHARYTRYADDLTFSGDAQFIPAIREFLPLVQQIIRSERFVVHKAKRKVVRPHQRQTVTGLVVNERVNISRREYDRLKAILHNCLKFGPSTQNSDGRDDFAAHLRGRIAHVLSVNPERGRKLLETFHKINWSR